jgi:hypothetical protein
MAAARGQVEHSWRGLSTFGFIFAPLFWERCLSLGLNSRLELGAPSWRVLCVSCALVVLLLAAGVLVCCLGLRRGGLLLLLELHAEALG